MNETNEQTSPADQTAVSAEPASTTVLTLKPEPTESSEPTAGLTTTPALTAAPEQTSTGPTTAPSPTQIARTTVTPLPTPGPSVKPTLTTTPTQTVKPKPTATPTLKPTLKPTATPTIKPTPKPTATPTPDPGDLSEEQWIAEVFRLTNLERQKAGLAVFRKPSAELLEAAAVRARECATLFSHTRPDGTEWHTVLTGMAYATAGENIACGTTGYLTPQMVVRLWMESEGHRKNILEPSFEVLGVGFYRSSAKNSDFLSQLFIG